MSWSIRNPLRVEFAWLPHWYSIHASHWQWASLPLTTIESNSKYPLYLMFALFANWSSPWKTTPYLFARTAPNLVAIAESSRRRRSGVYGCLARFVFHHAEDSCFEENSCRWKETPAHRKEVCSLLEDAAPAKASLISFRRHKMQRWKIERERSFGDGVGWGGGGGRQGVAVDLQGE